MFKLRDFDIGDARLFGVNIFRQRGEDGAQIEKFVLYALEDHGEQSEAGSDWQ